ncbi:MAG: hypothetical protein AAFU33_24725 [Bacteroidota bacterium]
MESTHTTQTTKGKQTSSGLALYVVFAPRHAKNTGKFIKPFTSSPYRNHREREKLLASARGYLERHKSKIAFFGVYDHPSNELVMRWPPAAESYGMLKLWMKYKPEHSPTTSGTTTESKYFHHTQTADHLMMELLEKGTNQILNEKVWLVRLYQQPGNTLLFEWSEEKGETAPGYWLEVLSRDYEV